MELIVVEYSNLESFKGGTLRFALFFLWILELFNGFKSQKGFQNQ